MFFYIKCLLLLLFILLCLFSFLFLSLVSFFQFFFMLILLVLFWCQYFSVSSYWLCLLGNEFDVRDKKYMICIVGSTSLNRGITECLVIGKREVLCQGVSMVSLFNCFLCLCQPLISVSQAQWEYVYNTVLNSVTLNTSNIIEINIL